MPNLLSRDLVGKQVPTGDYSDSCGKAEIRFFLVLIRIINDANYNVASYLLYLVTNKHLFTQLNTNTHYNVY